MKQLLEAGVHFGHQTRRWDPRMRRFIFTERNGIHILDLQQTVTRLNAAYDFVRDLVAGGGTLLFVGTKKQAQEAIEAEAKRCHMPYVNNRWLGGTLTNFQTIQSRIDHLVRLEEAKARGEFDRLPKKEIGQLDEEIERLNRHFGGVKEMTRLPAALFIVDTPKEHIAITEAVRLGIPIVAMCDTNSNPDVIDYPIPSNDDAIRAVKLITGRLADAVLEGAQAREFAEQEGLSANLEGMDVSATFSASPDEEPPSPEGEDEALGESAEA
ncbi:MAG TPA: 30S ribosomal protein S2 [Dehalococcoidia bacterium]|nr:30S ribosomal protein S2 [Dehalococcoidia bacterium]